MIPYSHFDGQVALFPAWGDGMPKRGPSTDRDNIEPCFSCHASINISRQYTDKSQAFGSVNAGAKHAVFYTITVSSPDGAYEDALGLKQHFANRQGKYCLTVLYRDDNGLTWTRFQFFHVEISADDLSEADDVNNRSMSFTAYHLDEDAGYIADGIPSLDPVVYGYVDWVHGSQRIPCLRYNRDTGKWNQRGASDTGIENQPYAMWDGPDVPLTPPSLQTFSMFQPRTDVVSGVMDITWQQRLIFSLENNGLTNGMIIQGALTWGDANGLYVPSGTVNGKTKYSLGSDWHIVATATVSGQWQWRILSGSGFLTVARYETPLGSHATPSGLLFERLGVGDLEVATCTEQLQAINKLLLHEGIQVEVNGSAEPVASIGQSIYLDESYCLFHCMGKVFMTVGHDAIAVPRVVPTPWLIHHGFAFKLGDTTLDEYGWWNVIA